MLKFIESILVEFRCCFRREATFKWFVVCTVAMMLRSDRLGVTSAVRDLCLSPGCYECLLHFFRSGAYSLEDLRQMWYRVVRDRAPLAMCRSRVILVGDGVKQAKEGRRMPGVKKMAQESETCSKPEYIHGHMFGTLGAVVQTSVKRFCMPLRINIQEGLKEASSWEEGKDILCISGWNHIEQMIGAAFEAAAGSGKAQEDSFDHAMNPRLARRITQVFSRLILGKGLFLSKKNIMEFELPGIRRIQPFTDCLSLRLCVTGIIHQAMSGGQKTGNGCQTVDV